ncbi:MAG: hypothetical protein O7F15_07170, partial [Gammaproteobacteria bacterium]|nr:hypothetical protein [Gammaproteobacteria bacterium]
MKPAHENLLTGDQFFLTRQTANLIEGFVREISDTSSIFLLYGEHSVGKSWLLQELSSRRISQRNICWIDFKTSDVQGSTNAVGAGMPRNGDVQGGTSAVGAGMPRSGTTDTESQDTASSPNQGKDASDIRELMEAADEGEIIIVDHFEDASNKARHQLFQSWTTDGIDKKLNLLIAASIDSFNEIRKLARLNQIEVKSFQLLPYSATDIEAFIGFYLFPLDPLLPLSIPAEVKKQIRNCNGIIGKVAAITALHKNQITQKTELESTTQSSVFIGSLITILVIVGTLYWYLQSAGQKQLMSVQESDTTRALIPEVEGIETVVTDITGPLQSDSRPEQMAHSSEMPGESTTPAIEVVMVEPV